MIPRVKVYVSEDTNNYFTSNVPFVPTVILKTTSGNIGTKEVVRSESDFIKKFGKGTTTTPAAYALQTYLRSYSYVNVTRIASASAAIGTATINGAISETSTALIDIKTDYKTANFNGVEVSLNYDTTGKKLYLSTEVDGIKTLSIKENIDLANENTKAPALEEALDKIITSFNATGIGLTLENKYVEKTAADPLPDAFTELVGTIGSGDSGLTGITDEQVLSAINLYTESGDTDIDILTIPEFNSETVITAATKAAEDYSFLFITSPNTNDLSTCLSTVATYPKSESLAVYWPNVKYNNFDATIPASIAVLGAYARNDSINKWLAPAGTTRGILSLVVEEDLNVPKALSENDLSSLYSNIIPVNPIKFVNNTGYCIWGQKTTATDKVYLDRLNISRLVKYIYKKVYSLSNKYLFEPITSNTFTLWKLDVEKLLADIKTGEGILDYSYKMDEENNTEETISQNKLIGQIRVKPTEVAEYIDIDFVLTSQV